MESTKSIQRKPAKFGEPVVDPAAWLPADLAATDEWMHDWNATELRALQDMARTVRRRIGDDPNGLLALDKQAFDLGPCESVVRKAFTLLRDGPGLALLRGLPVQEMDPVDVAIIYWGIGRHLGQARSNNPGGDMLGHVTDLGKTQADPTSRGYQTREAMDYHCDQASIVGLICIRAACSGGLSKIASSVSVYNELLRRSPSSVEILSKPLCWTKHGEVDPGEPGFYESAVFSVLDDMLCTSFGPKHIYKGHDLPEAPDLTRQQRSAIGLAEDIAEELHYEMELLRGDMQFLNNYVVLHTRTAYQDWPEPERKRLLWRLWLSAPDLRPATAYVKQWDAGIVLGSTQERILL
ncbi:TauD/TfdA family dioxygenase [Candidimonas nitroreducens]|nr:TauD/TfdA family dioxygenase [Candidimonas nitroreducens]